MFLARPSKALAMCQCNVINKLEMLEDWEFSRGFLKDSREPWKKVDVEARRSESPCGASSCIKKLKPENPRTSILYPLRSTC